MGDLCFTLLGPPEVRHADQVLLFSTRKELALLIYLAVEGRVHLRKTLSEQFWPEGDAMHGRAALRISLLHRIASREILPDGLLKTMPHDTEAPCAEVMRTMFEDSMLLQQSPPLEKSCARHLRRNDRYSPGCLTRNLPL